ncbi:hypothetical protein FYZ45_09320 [Mobiluncus mulieris]|uniref:Uncharacterized protein n=1 Tax=Mobiluncus mulieris TaxID=2052 RepID=A0ABD4TYS7_9ACTO|nr:hypothetical protein [Mobiluncus mulieris]MCU9971320.1 hypothetical protein [Mobiluncus mulieris]MCU9973430.1 hypothetical protein [Mobiluncus mulieris]MCV0010113.1 hypothetical protein [Mobiluncus mulieris]MCV0012014.1 hypothetical protein [Mobiluncus mulieris]
MTKGLIVFYIAIIAYVLYVTYTNKGGFYFLLGFFVLYVYSLNRDRGKRTPTNSRYRGFFRTDRGDRMD